MKILVFGNVGSGKTTIINKLKDIIPWEIIAIDDFRRKYGDGSFENELIAKKHFFNAVTNNKNQFIECIGVGNVSDELFSFLSQTNEEIICLKLIVPKEFCLLRLRNRIWDIPFPQNLDKVQSLIERTEQRINEYYIESLWGKRTNTTIISYVNIHPHDIEKIIGELAALLEQKKIIAKKELNDIEIMLNDSIQKYYGNEYLSYQKDVIDKIENYQSDRLLISKFISEQKLSGNILDIGSGNCQWFPLFEKTILHYYAVEVNSIALSLAPLNDLITTINQNVFENEFSLAKAIPVKINCVFFSFFLSHFSDASISNLLNKISEVNSLLIIDTLWSEKHKAKYLTKELRTIKRKIAKNNFIDLPKRFFEYSDIEKLITRYNFQITDFVKGNYWFACLIKKEIANAQS